MLKQYAMHLITTVELMFIAQLIVIAIVMNTNGAMGTDGRIMPTGQDQCRNLSQTAFKLAVFIVARRYNQDL